MSDKIVPLVLCGGSGARLWPSSRTSRPKQFLPLLGPLSTFQQTLRRISQPDRFARPVVVTNAAHRFLVADQLQSIGVEADVLLEPEGRDSAPAIAAGACFIARRSGADTPVLALAADHVVRDVEGFRASCDVALGGTHDGRIVIFGIEPDGPSTEYGYIEPGENLGEGVRAVARFVEKPDVETARRYVREGYLWNSGNFLFRAESLLDEYAAADPLSAASIKLAVSDATLDLGFLHLRRDAFSRARKISIDHAVMEKTTRAAFVAANFDWSDIGSWSAVHALSPKDEAENVARGPGTFLNARRNFVSSEGQHVSVVGLDDIAVVATPDAILVGRRDDTQGVRAVVEQLKSSNNSLTRDHVQCFRPWGFYHSLDLGERHQVKRIVVKPGGRLSLQTHMHRAEHWIVVRGTALVTVGVEIRTVHETESVYIPIGAMHRMENPGKIDLEIIEVQSGSYLGEDDIVRIEDVYNRIAS